MLILSADRHSEFLAVPSLFRIEYSHDSSGFIPTLYIKAISLSLRYITQGAKISIHVEELSNCILYAALVFEEENAPLVLWSTVERIDELKAIKEFLAGKNSYIGLFNELALNVAKTSVRVSKINLLDEDSLLNKLSGTVSNSENGEINTALKNIAALVPSNRMSYVADLIFESDWLTYNNSYISNELKRSIVDLSDKDEGNQQEQLIVWLVDSLSPDVSALSPQITESGRSREFTDVLLSHEFGSFLFESKTLNISSREKLPKRGRLAKKMISYVESKAPKQLKGAVKNLNRGIEIKNTEGVVLDIARDPPAHAIILIPDLNLLDESMGFGSQFASDFAKAVSAYIHILDVTELLRIVQAAQMVSNEYSTITPMSAFDYLLLERLETAVKEDNLCIRAIYKKG